MSANYAFEFTFPPTTVCEPSRRVASRRGSPEPALAPQSIPPDQPCHTALVEAQP